MPGNKEKPETPPEDAEPLAPHDFLFDIAQQKGMTYPQLIDHIKELAVTVADFDPDDLSWLDEMPENDLVEWLFECGLLDALFEGTDYSTV